MSASGTTKNVRGTASDESPALSEVYWKKGTEWVVMSAYCYGSGRTSNSPTPPRTAIFPLWNGSHAKPIRGSKFFVVGLLKKGLPRWGVASERFLKFASLPSVSVGTVDIS